jgi:hypothetical protein
MTLPDRISSALDLGWPPSRTRVTIRRLRSMGGVTEMDWHAWHDDYDKPGTPLARRLAAVQDQTRQRREPDLVPRIRDWFAEDGFEPVWVSDPARGWGVGAHRFTANPGPLQRGARMFRFTRRPPTLIFIPNGPGACPAALPGLAWALRPAGSLRPVRDPRRDLAA